MMYWAALRLETPLPSEHPKSANSAPEALRCELRAVATWALGFTPRVAVVEEAVLMEVEGSLRLFGGETRLRERIRRDAPVLGVSGIAWAPTGLGALALARAGVDDGMSRPLTDLLDALPLDVLSAARLHMPTLARLGCRTLGDVRRLPRGGVSRRFDKELLLALDHAYGLRPETFVWETLPDQFSARLELPSRVEHAPALVFGARRLLMQLAGWLAARHRGVTALTLSWTHDAMRSRDAGDGGELPLRTGAPTRDVDHLARLLNEHLQRTVLRAPVGELQLRADEVLPLAPPSGSLLPDDVEQCTPLRETLEHIAARLGPDRVLRPVLREDHRLEWMQSWERADNDTRSAPRRQKARHVGIPQPTWMLPEPLRLGMRGDRPMYQGVLQLLAGPHRVEGGWWDRTGTPDGQATRHVQRDYWVALSEHGGVLWIYRERLAEESAWYLQGVFA